MTLNPTHPRNMHGRPAVKKNGKTAQDDRETIPYMGSFLLYYGRVFLKTVRESKTWLRDNVVYALFMLIAPPAIIWSAHPDHALDWGLIKITVYVYLGVFAVYTLIQFVRSPWKLDCERVGEIQTTQTARDEYKSLNDAIENAKPKILLREPGPLQVREVSINRGGAVDFIAPFVTVRFVNKPPQHCPDSVAKQIRAKVKFFNPADVLLLEMDGRWADSSQPGSLGPLQSRKDLLPIDFGIEEEHDLDLVFRDVHNRDFVGWNNDSFGFQKGRKPDHIMHTNRVWVEVRLVGLWVDESVSFELGVDTDDSVILLSAPVQK